MSESVASKRRGSGGWGEKMPAVAIAPAPSCCCLLLASAVERVRMERAKRARSESKIVQRKSMTLKTEMHTEDNGLEQRSESNNGTEAAESMVSNALGRRSIGGMRHVKNRIGAFRTNTSH